ncbi:MATE family efflux transporter [Acidaminobacter sp.]|uniref:MATE family efflux transporter n=2 Tax=Acidaminobacter sp. TaxID=1872102 RepID=UPI00255F1A3B|nr:MATE family efflux transporter [Acidaminobacter sp.]MDK9710115.1 MATE family efflux transporter [Acidaminobacter sp.]
MTHTDLTTGDIKAHIKRLTIPASIGWFFNTMFNVVDTFYAGKISTTALAGLSMSFPIFFMVIAFSSGLGTGSTALISNALGRKSREDYHRLGLNALVLAWILGLGLMAVGLLAGRPIFELMGAGGEVLDYGVRYIDVIFLGAVFFISNHILNAMLASQGDTRSNRNYLFVAFVLNIILDPIFMFGWLGFPAMGTAGVALATILVQLYGNVYLARKVVKSPAFSLHLLKTARLSVRTMLEILHQALPASLNMMTNSLGLFIVNAYAMRYGGDAVVAAYGASLRIEQLTTLPALGLNMAALTIAGQNFGAGRLDRVREVYRQCLKYGFVLMTSGMVVIFLLARVLISTFNNDPAVVSAGITIIRIVVLVFNAYMLVNVSLAIMQASKRPYVAMGIGFLRQIALPSFMFYFLGTTLAMGVRGIWTGLVINNWIAAAVAVLYAHRTLRRMEEARRPQ